MIEQLECECHATPFDHLQGAFNALADEYDSYRVKYRDEVTMAIANLAAEIHDAWEYQYDECTHGTYSGPLQGTPYAMCEIFARLIISKRTGAFL